VLINPKIAPKLPIEQQRAPVPPWLAHISAQYSRRMLPALAAAVVMPARAVSASAGAAATTWSRLFKSLLQALVPVALAAVTLGAVWWYVVIHSQADNAAATASASAPAMRTAQPAAGTAPAPGGLAEPASNGVQEPPASGVQEPPAAGLQEPPSSDAAPAASGVQEPPGSDTAATQSGGVAEPPGSETAKAAAAGDEPLQQMGDPSAVDAPHQVSVPDAFYTGFWITCAITLGLLLWYYWRFDAEQFEILRMLISSVMPLAILTFVVLAVILFGITTATESAAVGAAGAFLMAWHAGTLNFQRIKEAVFLTAKTTSMVCWLFVGSALFSAVFAILGGQRVVEQWVLSMDLSPIQFMLLSQAIIFVLGWPLEWTEIIVIFVPIFLPLLTHFHIDPMLWGVLVFVNLQAAFLSPPVAMSAFYLKGVSPKHVTINQIFAGMMPYMLIVIVCMVLMYIWPALTLWLPNYLYG
jgi:TRAP-type mannitol/chloroaromatic compound transport system permease large subunit